MNRKNENIHLGQEVQKKVKERGMSVSEFARRIMRSRTDVYDIYRRKYIDLSLLRTISDVLDYPFIQLIK